MRFIIVIFVTYSIISIDYISNFSGKSSKSIEGNHSNFISLQPAILAHFWTKNAKSADFSDSARMYNDLL